MKNLCDGSEQTNMTGADGKYAFELIPGCDFELNAFKDGYIDLTNPISSDEIEDTLNTDENKPVSTIKVNKIKRGKPKVISKNIDLVEVGDFITINKIFNDKLSTQISGEATNELNKLVATLRHHPAMMIEVGSHIDSKGDASDNLQLTQRRSNSIVDYMVGKGIERSRMIPKGYGESMLVNKCRDGIVCTEREHERNRRTTIRILKIRPR
jgi:outer membrane protein OmpA-like peptidoglycan-associated protein